MTTGSPGRSSIRRVGLCLKPDSPQAAETARALTKWLAERGVEVFADHDAATLLELPGQDRAALSERADLLVVLGGDGTLLSVVREVRGPVPILGVNLGTLGFLAEVGPEEQLTLLEQVLNGEFEVVARMRLEVRALREGRELLRGLALNDAVITRSDLSRMIDLETRSDAVPVTTYHADGLIVATPTGSTAYNLSAGGPILMPGSRVFVLTPICPHALSQRPLVLSESGALEIHVFPREGTAQLTVDGQVGCVLESGDVVTVEVAAHPAHFVVSPFLSRFEVLRTKLGWGAS